MDPQASRASAQADSRRGVRAFDQVTRYLTAHRMQGRHGPLQGERGLSTVARDGPRRRARCSPEGSPRTEFAATGELRIPHKPFNYRSYFSYSDNSNRYCCKSRFAQVVKNSAGCRRRFRVRSGGTSSSHARRIDGLGSATTTMRIGDYGALQVLAKNSDRCNFRILQQYVPQADIGT